MTEPEPECPRCEGFGWVEVEGGRRARCSCVLDRLRAERAEAIRLMIPAAYRHCCRASWIGGWPLDSAADKWLPASGSWVGPWAVILLGPKGTGKTHIATALFRRVLEAELELSGLWMDAEEALAMTKAEIGAAGRSGLSIAERLARVGLLLYDDVGRMRASTSRGEASYGVEMIRSTLHRRHLHRLPTIITSNAADLSEFSKVDPALASRLADETLVYELHGPDRRINR